MKLLVISVLIILFSSCSHLPGHYLSKHNPGAFSKKNDANVSLLIEANDGKYGGNLSYCQSLTNHFFAGISGNVFSRNNDLPPTERTTSGHQLFNMKGFGVRPFAGYFLDFGKRGKSYLEVYGGGGFQYNSYNIFSTRDQIIISDYTRPIQIFAGSFIGWKHSRGTIGFDLSYERNWFIHPAKVFYYDRNFDNSESFSIKNRSFSHNVNSSFYAILGTNRFKLLFNAGWNAGYAEFFGRMGVRYSMAAY